MFKFIDVRYKNILDLPAMQIESGKITTFIGPSGSGKTTILKLLNKMVSPTQGKILFNNTDLSQTNSISHRRQVAMLSQNPAMFAGSIRDNLTAGLRFQGRNLPEDDVLVKVMEQVQVRKPLDSSAQTLSGGEKQRLALGRVLLLDPQVYLLDEPSSALDEHTEEMVIQMITNHVKKKGKTLVMVTHSGIIADKYSDHIIALTNGRCLSRR
ncbi:MAG: ABC transporter ATP-binding protein [Syntrophomonadaceae bacterium]|jgi:putative ABC transport system ATP-binding protein